jgi:hypothetical protein
MPMGKSCQLGGYMSGAGQKVWLVGGWAGQALTPGGRSGNSSSK